MRKIKDLNNGLITINSTIDKTIIAYKSQCIKRKTYIYVE